MSRSPSGTAMIRRQLYVTARQDMIIRKLAARSGITASEHYRRAIDAYINRATAAEEKKAAAQAEKDTAAALGVGAPGKREKFRAHTPVPVPAKTKRRG